MPPSLILQILIFCENFLSHLIQNWQFFTKPQMVTLPILYLNFSVPKSRAPPSPKSKLSVWGNLQLKILRHELVPHVFIYYMYMTKVIAHGFDGPRGHYVFPLGSIGEEELINNGQRRTLTELILRNIEDSNEQEQRLALLDDLTVREADKAIFEFMAANW